MYDNEEIKSKETVIWNKDTDNIKIHFVNIYVNSNNPQKHGHHVNIKQSLQCVNCLKHLSQYLH